MSSGGKKQTVKTIPFPCGGPAKPLPFIPTVPVFPVERGVLVVSVVPFRPDYGYG